MITSGVIKKLEIIVDFACLWTSWLEVGQLGTKESSVVQSLEINVYGQASFTNRYQLIMISIRVFSSTK